MRTTYHYMRLFLPVALLLSLLAATVAAAPVPVARASSALSVYLSALANPEARTRNDLPASGPGGLQHSAGGELLVTIRVADPGPHTQAALKQAGASIQQVAGEYAMLTAYVAPDALEAVAAVAGVQYVSEALAPRSRSNGGAPAKRASHRPTLAATCPTGVQSEGVVQLNVDDARAQFAVDGAGVKIGVISDSFNTAGKTINASADIASGDLPGAANPCGNTRPVQVVAELKAVGSDEGRAMLQIVHDIAPKAELAFATAGGTMFEMADNLRALQAAGASVTVDDIVFYGEPMFQPGPINVAISEGAAKGVTHFTAAGNANVTDGSGANITSYETTAFRPTACPALKLRNSQNQLVPAPLTGVCHTFRPDGVADATSRFSLDRGGGIDMEFQWAEPWFGVTTDLNIYLIDDATGEVLRSGVEENIVKSQTPFERIVFSTSSPRNVALVVNRVLGTGTPRFKYVLQNAANIATTEYNAATNTIDTFGPSVGDHVATNEVIGVGAVPYNDGSRTEEFSALGPATHYFGPLLLNPTKIPIVDGADALSQPIVMAEPDLVATNGNLTTFFGQGNRFYGTSAAAPHAAGVAALFVQRARTLGFTPNHLVIETYLEAGAAAVPNGERAAVGAGLIDAARSLALLEALKPRQYLPLAGQ